jgi:hypothetical protein
MFGPLCEFAFWLVYRSCRVFAGADSSLVSLASAIPAIGTLDLIPGFLAQADVPDRQLGQR